MQTVNAIGQIERVSSLSWTFVSWTVAVIKYRSAIIDFTFSLPTFLVEEALLWCSHPELFSSLLYQFKSSSYLHVWHRLILWITRNIHNVLNLHCLWFELGKYFFTKGFIDLRQLSFIFKSLSSS